MNPVAYCPGQRPLLRRARAALAIITCGFLLAVTLAARAGASPAAPPAYAITDLGTLGGNATLSSGQDLVVSYVVNSFDFWQVAREAKLYWPRFVRVTLAPSE